jgi:hypothetical protein
MPPCGWALVLACKGWDLGLRFGFWDLLPRPLAEAIIPLHELFNLMDEEQAYAVASDAARRALTSRAPAAQKRTPLLRTSSGIDIAGAPVLRTPRSLWPPTRARRPATCGWHYSDSQRGVFLKPNGPIVDYSIWILFRAWPISAWRNAYWRQDVPRKLFTSLNAASN